jgi:polyisoprenoid-binding protein YceI
MSNASSADTAAVYTIDASHSSVGFKIRHFMVAYVRGGFSGISGDVIFDPANPANTKINASIDVATLHTHDARRDADIKAEKFLDAERHPSMTFVSKSVTPDGKNQWKLTGDLTLRGVTQEVTLDVESAGVESKDPWGKIRTGASAEGVIKRGDFGLTFNAPLETGGFILGDDVQVHLEIELVKKA